MSNRVCEKIIEECLYCDKNKTYSYSHEGKNIVVKSCYVMSAKIKEKVSGGSWKNWLEILPDEKLGIHNYIDLINIVPVAVRG